MRHRQSSHRAAIDPQFHVKVNRGFTLIEVLVVVAIIALLISILLPSLSRAREQARQVVCVANLKGINLAAAAYMLDQKDRFPWGMQQGAPGQQIARIKNPGWRTWAYGGARGHWVSDWPWYPNADYLPSERGLNRYVYSPTKLGALTATPLNAGSRGPSSKGFEVFQCPSDKGLRVNGNVSMPPTLDPCHYVTGSSYSANTDWAFYAEDFEGLGNQTSARLEYLRKNIIRIMRRHGAEKFVLIAEDPMDWACSTTDSWGRIAPETPSRYKVRGWHGKLDYHSAMFLDGHAENLFVNHRYNSSTIRYNSGTSRWIRRQDYREQ